MGEVGSLNNVTLKIKDFKNHVEKKAVYWVTGKGPVAEIDVTIVADVDKSPLKRLSFDIIYEATVRKLLSKNYDTAYQEINTMIHETLNRGRAKLEETIRVVSPVAYAIDNLLENDVQISAKDAGEILFDASKSVQRSKTNDLMEWIWFKVYST